MASAGCTRREKAQLRKRNRNRLKARDRRRKMSQKGYEQGPNLTPSPFLARRVSRFLKKLFFVPETPRIRRRAA